MSKPLNIIFLLAVLLYMGGLFSELDFLWLLKVLPIAVLGMAALKLQASTIRTILLWAIFFSACGDLLLAFDGFIYGVGAFLLAQLCYGFIFKFHWLSISRRWPMSVLLVIVMATMAWLLLPKLGNLQLAVLAYLCVIGLMGLLAVQSSFATRWAVVGALVFIVSDSLIAINKFLYPVPFESYWIMSTYYAAQFMLVSSFVKSESRAGH